MKLFFVWAFSILFAGIIISPFFWLKFLKVKGVGKYLTVSSASTLLLFWISLTWVYDFILKYVNSYNVLYYFDNIFLAYSDMVIFLIIISPFIFTKISKAKFSVRSLFLNLFLSVLIFISVFLYWALVLLPKAFSELHNHF